MFVGLDESRTLNGGHSQDFYLENGNRMAEPGSRFADFSPWEWNIYEVAWSRSTRIPR